MITQKECDPTMMKKRGSRECLIKEEKQRNGEWGDLAGKVGAREGKTDRPGWKV